MDLDTFISFAQAFIGVALTLLGLLVTTRTELLARWRRACELVFAGLGLVLIALIAVQGIRATKERRRADAQMATISTQVAFLYELQTIPRTTPEELTALSNRAAILRKEHAAKQDLKSRAKLLAAEISLFVGERSAGEPEGDLYGDGKISDLVAMMNQPRNPRRPTIEEIVASAHRGNQAVSPDFSKITPNEYDSAWLEKNWPSIEYYFQTRILFGKQFGARVDEIQTAIGVRHGLVPGRPLLSDEQWKQFKIDEANVRAADALVHNAMKEWKRTGRKPANFDALYSNLKSAQGKVISLAGNLNVPKGENRSVSDSYPTTLLGMRELAEEIESAARNLP